MPITIYHNPACGTSRNVLAVVKASGEAFEVVEYLNAGWTHAQLVELFAAAGVTPRAALRTSKSPAEDMGLTDPAVSDEVLLDAMVDHPILVNRPFVVSAKGTALCRPSQEVVALLQTVPKGPLLKEDGTVIIDPEGKFVG